MALKVICDTDVMIDYWDTLNPRQSKTKSILEGMITLDRIVLSAITKMELIPTLTLTKMISYVNLYFYRPYACLSPACR